MPRHFWDVRFGLEATYIYQIGLIVANEEVLFYQRYKNWTLMATQLLIKDDPRQLTDAAEEMALLSRDSCPSRDVEFTLLLD